MINPMELTGKRIMVTGASSGIGRETAILLSNLGAQVVLLGRDEQRLAETKDNLSGEGHVSISLELREFEKYADAFKQIKETGKKLDGFVHCAGIAKVIPLKVASANVIQDMFAVNYVSFMELMKHFAKKTNSDGGSVVCLSAINAHYPQKCMSVSSLAVELFEKKIRVNAVVPGPIATPMAASFSEVSGEESNIVGQQLMALGEPADIANMTAYLLSDASKFITGRKFYVDGGRL